MSSTISRRQLLGAVAGAGGALAAEFAGAVETQPADSSKRKQRVVVVGGHPDDPESGCGGAMARLADSGPEVVALYLTRGGAGVKGKTHPEAATNPTPQSHGGRKKPKAPPPLG